MVNLTHFDHGRTPGCWSTSRPSGYFRSSSWCPPPPGWIKVSVDGSLLPSRCSGLGIVVGERIGVDGGGLYLATLGPGPWWSSRRSWRSAELFF
ncbi:hypothetical protein KSP40_PGU017579 [Platanthera guangdongensis]|uniref:Uncharacterized protein n=1 Tax=Platanthera guangdongensis TaxID=2320717 RepID=A0ABR2LK65_9ASPA